MDQTQDAFPVIRCLAGIVDIVDVQWLLCLAFCFVPDVERARIFRVRFELPRRVAESFVNQEAYPSRSTFAGCRIA